MGRGGGTGSGGAGYGGPRGAEEKTQHLLLREPAPCSRLQLDAQL